MDRLEDFIKKNREALDRYDPPSSSWRKIKNMLPPRRKTVFSGWNAAAAIALLILGSAVLYYAGSRNRSGGNLLYSSGQKIYNSNPVLKEAEIYYNTVIDKLYSEAKPLLTSHPELERELNADISQIDSISADIRKDLRDNVANQEVIEAMINNYRIKIRLLEDLLEALNEDTEQIEKNLDHAI